MRSARFRLLVCRALDGLLVSLVAAVLVALTLGRIVPFFGGTTLVVGGPSMEPAVPVGAAIVALPTDPRDLAVGHVVSVRIAPHQAVFTHRIVRTVERRGEIWLETAGDANPEPDPAIFPASAVIGRVGLVVPYTGYLLAVLSNFSGLAFIIGLAAVLVSAAWLIEPEARGPDRRRLTAGGPAAVPLAGGDPPRLAAE